MSKAKKIIIAISCSILYVVFLFCSVIGFIGIVRDITLHNSNAQTICATADKIVLLIGDGMGFGHVETTSAYVEAPLYMQRLSKSGKVTTNSLNVLGPTDSAAGATALATGHKVENGVLAYNGSDIESISEIAKSQNKGVGIVCTDTLSGATPAGFSAHTSSRSNTAEIRHDQFESNIDIFLGAGKDEYLSEQTLIEQNGYSFCTTLDSLDSEQNKILGAFDSVVNETGTSTSPTLNELTLFAITFLEAKYPNGYFLMVEGSHIDKRSHSNDLFGMINYLKEFDKCVQTTSNVLQSQSKDYVLIVTADHETGGLNYTNQTKAQLSNDMYSTTSHTSRKVPYYIDGNVTRFDNVVDNTDIFRLMANAFSN